MDISGRFASTRTAPDVELFLSGYSQTVKYSDMHATYKRRDRIKRKREKRDRHTEKERKGAYNEEK